jgi:hypothetical protein
VAEEAESKKNNDGNQRVPGTQALPESVTRIFIVDSEGHVLMVQI